MSDLLHKQVCLALNKNFFAIDYRTVKKSLEDIFSINPQTDKPPFVPLDLEFEMNDDGSYNTEVLLGLTPVSIERWVELPVRSCDLAITTSQGDIRVPTVIVASSYSDIPKKLPKFSSEGVWARDRGVCQATGRKLSRDEGDLGHNIARAHGGRRVWENIALLDKTINRQQGTKTFEEMGWHIKPKAPMARAVLFTVNDIKHPSQIHFVERN